MSRLCALLELIESGTPGRFHRDEPPVMLPALPAKHAPSITCTCEHCERMWTR